MSPGRRGIGWYDGAWGEGSGGNDRERGPKEELIGSYPCRFISSLLLAVVAMDPSLPNYRSATDPPMDPPTATSPAAQDRYADPQCYLSHLLR